jgi:16S rRNA processing protein RimM
VEERDPAGPGDPRALVTVGRITGVHGVRGRVKVFSYTDPRDNVLSYPEWWLTRGRERRLFRVRDGHSGGRTITAALESIEDRDAAEAWIGAEIAVERSSLPDPGEGQYYWADLVGLEVCDGRGERLGSIERMLETGAHDVMVVRREEGDELLIPFVVGEIVQAVRLEEGRVVVDWEWS